MSDRGGDILGRFGISSDVEEIWLALIDAGESSVAQLAEAAQRSEAEVTVAVERLLNEGLVHCNPLDDQFRATEPTIAIQAHLSRAERRLVDELEALNQIRADLPDLSKRHAKSPRAKDRNSSFEVILDQVDIRRHLALASENATAIVRGMIRQATARVVRNDLATELAAGARGVERRSLVTAQHLADMERFEAQRSLHEIGDLCRSLPELPIHMVIFDDDLVVLPTVPENVNLGAMFIRERGVIEPMIALFDHLWSIAQPVFNDVSEGELGARTTRVLELVSAGSTDDSIARALGITVRTVRREVATLRQALDVGSRMEIVPAAVRRGWL